MLLVLAMSRPQGIAEDDVIYARSGELANPGAGNEPYALKWIAKDPNAPIVRFIMLLSNGQNVTDSIRTRNRADILTTDNRVGIGTLASYFNTQFWPAFLATGA
eukprot:SAG31_NODE_1595_length_7803_cov_15.169522_4_plen_104_part_00